MKLTKKKAIEISIELWTWLAKTGRRKWNWDGWEKYGQMVNDCPFCQYRHQRNVARDRNLIDCSPCPYYRAFDKCYSWKLITPYDKWEDAKTLKARKEYAKLFLEQLKEL